MTHWTIVPAEEPDLPAILDLVHRAYAANAKLGFQFYGSREKPEDIRQSFQDGVLYKMLEDGKLVGTVRLAAKPEGCLYINRLCVEPERQRGGLGARLIAFAEEEARRRGLGALRLDTAKPFEVLVKWYERHGFVVIGETQWDVTNYRSVVMEKVILPR